MSVTDTSSTDAAAPSVIEAQPTRTNTPVTFIASHPYRRTILLSLASSFVLFSFLATIDSPRSFFFRFNDDTNNNDNIINGPPIALEHGETTVSRRQIAATTKKKKKSTPHPHQKKPTTPTAVERAPIPVVEFDDSQLPGFFLDNTPQTAAEVLACKDSVLNYVINATDTKDECDGLTKAFEKTCNTARKAPPERRRLRDKLYYKTQQPWQLFLFWVSSQYQTLLSRMSSLTFFFFADEAVVDAWGQASYLVDHQLDDTPTVSTRNMVYRRILLQKSKTFL